MASVESEDAARAYARGVDVTLQQGRAEQLPFDDASFDVVLAVTVLCLVPDPGRPRLRRRRGRPGHRGPRAGVEARGDQDKGLTTALR